MVVFGVRIGVSERFFGRRTTIRVESFDFHVQIRRQRILHHLNGVCSVQRVHFSLQDVKSGDVELGSIILDVPLHVAFMISSLGHDLGLVVIHLGLLIIFVVILTLVA